MATGAQPTTASQLHTINKASSYCTHQVFPCLPVYGSVVSGLCIASASLWYQVFSLKPWLPDSGITWSALGFFWERQIRCQKEKFKIRVPMHLNKQSWYVLLKNFLWRKMWLFQHQDPSEENILIQVFYFLIRRIKATIQIIPASNSQAEQQASFENMTRNFLFPSYISNGKRDFSCWCFHFLDSWFSCNLQFGDFFLLLSDISTFPSDSPLRMTWKHQDFQQVKVSVYFPALPGWQDRG